MIFVRFYLKNACFTKAKIYDFIAIMQCTLHKPQDEPLNNNTIFTNNLKEENKRKIRQQKGTSRSYRINNEK